MKMSNKILTATPFRGSFVSLVEPVLPFGETDETKAKRQMTIVLPKDDPFWKQVKAEVKAAAVDKFGKVPATLRIPFKDGDEMVNDDGELKYPEFEGCYTLQVSTKRKPDVVDAALQPVIDPEKLYSGAYYRAACRAYAWSHPTGGKGVSFSLETVQWVKDGESFGGGGGSAATDFGDFKEEKASAGAGADSLLD